MVDAHAVWPTALQQQQQGVQAVQERRSPRGYIFVRDSVEAELLCAAADPLLAQAGSETTAPLTPVYPGAPMHWPYLVVPLMSHAAHGAAALGTLNVDGLGIVQAGRKDEVQPERGLVEYLQQVR